MEIPSSKVLTKPLVVNLELRMVTLSGRDGIWAVRELYRILQCRAWDGEGELDFKNPKDWLKEALEASDLARRNSSLIET